MDSFIRSYFKKMNQMAREKGLPVENLIERLWKGTAAMIDNKDHSLTNEQVFRDYFFSPVDYLPEMYQPFFDEFYDQGFDQLSGHARSFPLARPVVETAFSQGGKIVIATQPVFPEVAIRKRLGWAGLGDCKFDLITSHERMHFTKPHKEYYLEIADLLGVDPGRCLMVGNDVREDMQAVKAGMKTFLVKDRMINRDELPIRADWQGYLADLLAFFRENGMDADR